MKKRGLSFPVVIMIILFFIMLVIATFFLAPIIKERFENKEDTSSLDEINNSQAQVKDLGGGTTGETTNEEETPTQEESNKEAEDLIELQDQIPNCTSSDWTYNITPLDCPLTETQTKTWTKIGDCENGIEHDSSEIISCNYNVPTCTSFTYSAWGECISSGTQLRSVLSSLPNGCQNGIPVLSQECEYVVQSCVDGTSLNSCSLTKPLYCNAVGELSYDCGVCGCYSGYDCESSQCRAGDYDSIITINAENIIGDINPLVYGSNLMWNKNAGSLWNNGGFSSYPLQKIKEMNPSIIRFPGGNLANDYHWKKAIGSQQERTGMEPQENPSNFGTDEFMEFLDEINAQAMITVNAHSGTAQEASQWVEYLNGEIPSNTNGFHIDDYKGTYRESSLSEELNFGWWADSIFSESFESLNSVIQNSESAEGIDIVSGYSGNAVYIDNSDTLSFQLPNFDLSKGAIDLRIKPNFDISQNTDPLNNNHYHTLAKINPKAGNSWNEQSFFLEYQPAIQAYKCIWYDSNKIEHSVSTKNLDYEYRSGKEWYRVTCGWDSTKGRIALYVDGILADYKKSSPWEIIETDNKIYVGMGSSEGYRVFDGTIDEFKIMEEDKIFHLRIPIYVQDGYVFSKGMVVKIDNEFVEIQEVNGNELMIIRSPEYNAPGLIHNKGTKVSGWDYIPTNSLPEGYFAWLRGQYGNPEPYNVKYWEIGNELYMWYNPNGFEGNFYTPDEYGDRVSEFANAMKSIDSSIKIGGIGFERIQGPSWQTEDWNSNVLERAGNYMDFFVQHLYFGGEPADILATPQWYEDLLSELKNLIQQKTGKELEIAITEYNAGYNQQEIISLTNALWTADMFQIFMKNNIIGNYWNLITDHKTSGGTFSSLGLDSSSGDYAIRPSYYVFNLFTNHFGDKLIETNVQTSSYSYQWDESIEVPYLSVVTSKNNDGNKLYLMVINKNLNTDINTMINVNDFSVKNSAKVYTINAQSIESTNENQENIKIIEQEISVANSFIYNFPAHSITLIEFN